MLAAAIPLFLAARFLLARLAKNKDLARTSARTFRVVLAVEVAALVIFALIGLRYEHGARQKEAAQFHPPGKLVDVGGNRLHLYCTGGGPLTVVLEHGHGATYLDWYLVQPELAKLTRVCSYDRAGYGWSEPSPRNRIPSLMADELHSALHAAGENSPYVLVGHSFGAMDAIMFAHKFSNEVTALVLVDGSTPESLHPARWREKLWLRTIQLTMPFGLPRWRRWCGGGPAETAGMRQALTCRSQTIQTILREDAAFPVTARELGAISTLGSVPIVVIARDPASDENSKFETRHAQQQRDLAKLSTNSRFIVAQGSGHDVPLARPDVIAEAVKTLLKPQAQAGSRGTP